MSSTLNNNTNDKKVYGLNLVGNFKMKKKEDKRLYKNAYNKLFSVNGQLSSTNFLRLYTLFMLRTLNRPVYGKEVLDELNSMYDNSDWKFSHGTLYPILTKMEAAGLIVVDEDMTTKVRKYYRITPDGEDFLESQIDEFKASIMTSGKFFNKVISQLYK